MKEIITPEDTATIREWNSVPQPLEWRTIHDCIAEYAAKDPDRPAIEAWDGALTCRQVEEHSSKLAKFLSQEGLMEGDVASILVRRSVWVPVVMLAVLKAGAAFILLDHCLSYKRLKIIVESISSRFAITSREDAGLACDLFPTGSTSVVILNIDGVPYTFDTINGPCKDTIDGASEQVNDGISKPNPTRGKKGLNRVSPDATAFLICTSGSTGVPKTIILQHFAWASGYARNMHYHDVTEGTRVLQQSSFSFVVSVFEMLSTLMAGGVVCIPSEFERKNEFADAIRRLRPDFAAMAPSAAKVLHPEEVPSIKTLTLTGEAVPFSMIKLWATDGKRKIMNGYGQSEGASYNGLGALDPGQPVCRNIGGSKWIRFWVVHPEDYNTLLPIGALGELLLEGYSLARGYLNNPEQTAKVFIDKPTWAEQFGAGQGGRRWYLTGDLVRYQPNGDLHLYGRKDAQVKIRGQRVDTAEVEHHILGQLESSVRQVVVVKTVAPRDQEQLTAFLTLKSDDSQNSAYEGLPKNDGLPSRHTIASPEYNNVAGSIHRQLSDYLREIVPSYMIPQSIVLAQSLPTTATSKVDRRRLIEWFQETTIAADESSEQSAKRLVNRPDPHNLLPEGPIRLIAELLSNHLQIPIDEFQPDSIWSTYGADSIKAISVIRSLREAGFLIGLEELMSDMPIKQMAERLARDQNNVKPTEHTVYSLRDSLIPLTDFQSHCVDASLGRPQSLIVRYDMSIVGHYDPARLERAFRTVVENTEALRLAFVFDGSNQPAERRFRLLDPDNPLVTQCIMRTPKIDESTGASTDFLPPSCGNLFRAWICSDLCNLGTTIRIKAHHAILDATSWTLLFQDISLAYQRDDGSVLGRPGFVSFLSRHNKRRASSRESSSYWRNIFQNSRLTLLRRSVADLTQPYGVSDIYASTKVFRLPRPANPTPITTSTLVKAAWSVVLSCLADTRDVVFQHLMHGRDEAIPEDEGVIGCCITEVPMRVALDSEMTARSLLSSVQSQVLQSMPHAYLGAGAINKLMGWVGGNQLYQHSSFIQHQNVEETMHATLGDDAYLVAASVHHVSDLQGDFEIFSRDCGTGVLELTISTHRHLYTATEVNMISTAIVYSARCLLNDWAVMDVRKNVRRKLDHLAA